MNFLGDAHLPSGLCAVFRAAGHDAIHTAQLPAQNRTRDDVLNQLSLKEQRVVVTKDTDFYHSHLLHGKPWKLLLVRAGRRFGFWPESEIAPERKGRVSRLPRAKDLIRANEKPVWEPIND